MHRKTERLLALLLIPCLVADPVAAAGARPGAGFAGKLATVQPIFGVQALSAALQAMRRPYATVQAAVLRRQAVQASQATDPGDIAWLIVLAAQLDLQVNIPGRRQIQLVIDHPRQEAVLSRLLGQPVVPIHRQILLERDEAERLSALLRSGPPFRGDPDLHLRHQRPRVSSREDRPVIQADPRDSESAGRAERWELRLYYPLSRPFLKIRGLEHLPTGNAILAGNHINRGFDAFFIVMAVYHQTGRFPAVLTNPEAYSINRFARYFLSRVQVIDVSQGKPVTRILEALREPGRKILVFPAGRPGHQQPDTLAWKPSVAMLSADSQVPIIPFAMSRTPQAGFWPHFTLAFGPPQQIVGPKPQIRIQFENVKAAVHDLYAENQSQSVQRSAMRQQIISGLQPTRGPRSDRRFWPGFDAPFRPFEIYEAKPSELFEILRLRKAEFEKRTAPSEWLGADTAFLVNLQLLVRGGGRPGFVLLGRSQGKLVGYVAVIEKQDQPGVGDIAELVVARSEEKKRFGTRLVAAALDRMTSDFEAALIRDRSTGEKIARIAQRFGFARVSAPDSQYRRALKAPRGQHLLDQPGFTPAQERQVGPLMEAVGIPMTVQQRRRAAYWIETWWARAKEDSEDPADQALDLLKKRTPLVFHQAVARLAEVLRDDNPQVLIDGTPHAVRILVVPTDKFVASNGVTVKSFAWAHLRSGKPTVTLCIPPKMASLCHEMMERVVLPGMPTFLPQQYHFLASLSEVLAEGTIYGLPDGTQVPYPLRTLQEIRALPNEAAFRARNKEAREWEIPLRFPEGRDDYRQLRELNMDFSRGLLEMLLNFLREVHQALQQPPQTGKLEKPLTHFFSGRETLEWIDRAPGSVLVRSAQDPWNDVMVLQPGVAKSAVSEGFIRLARWGDDQALFWVGAYRRSRFGGPFANPTLAPFKATGRVKLMVRGKHLSLVTREQGVEIYLADPSWRRRIHHAIPVPMYKDFRVGSFAADYGKPDWNLAPTQMVIRVSPVSGRIGIYLFQITDMTQDDPIDVFWETPPAPGLGSRHGLFRMLVPFIAPAWLGWQLYSGLAAGPQPAILQAGLSVGVLSWIAGSVVAAWDAWTRRADARPGALSPRQRWIKTAA